MELKDTIELMQSEDYKARKDSKLSIIRLR